MSNIRAGISVMEEWRATVFTAPAKNVPIILALLFDLRAMSLLGGYAALERLRAGRREIGKLCGQRLLNQTQVANNDDRTLVSLNSDTKFLPGYAAWRQCSLQGNRW